MNAPAQGPKDRAPARVGQVLRGKWKLDSLLAVGGMASVYAATHRNGKRGAVKLLHFELSLNEESKSRFLREGYVANKVDHEGAVSVLDDDVCEDGTVFLVMELLEGMTVDALLRTRKTKSFGLGETLRIGDRLLDVLSAAHDKGVVHRDIKPENLFLTKDGKLKVLDFGIARLREAHADPNQTRAGDLLGTPSFMPPEQALGNSEQVDARSDLWSVGATMFRLLSGRTVHQAESVNRVLFAAMTMPAPPLSSILPTVPPQLAYLVDRALAFHQNERWPDARSMRAALRDFALRGGIRVDGPVLAGAGEENIARGSTLPIDGSGLFEGASPTQRGHGSATGAPPYDSPSRSLAAPVDFSASAAYPMSAPPPLQPDPRRASALMPRREPPPAPGAGTLPPPAFASAVAAPPPGDAYALGRSGAHFAPAAQSPAIYSPAAPVQLLDDFVPQPEPDDEEETRFRVPGTATAPPVSVSAFVAAVPGPETAAPLGPPVGNVTAPMLAVSHRPGAAPGAGSPTAGYYPSPGRPPSATASLSSPLVLAPEPAADFAPPSVPIHSEPPSPSFSTASPVSRDPTFGGLRPRTRPTMLYIVLGAAAAVGGVAAIVILSGGSEPGPSSGAQPASTTVAAASDSAQPQSAPPPPSTPPPPTAEPSASAARAASSAPAASAAPSATPKSAPKSSATASPKRPGGTSKDPFNSRKW